MIDHEVLKETMEAGSREIVAENLRRLMRKKGVAASDVCKAVGIPNATFSDWLHARTYPRISKLEKLAEYFGVGKAEITEVYIDKEDPVLQLARERTEDEFPEVTLLARAGKKMSPERRQDMIKLLKIAFPEEFGDE